MKENAAHSRRIYFGAYAALVALTIVTVLVSYVNLGLMNVFVALAIASTKAALVALFFMHLKDEKPLVWGFALVPLFFLALILGGTLIDTLYR